MLIKKEKKEILEKLKDRTLLKIIIVLMVNVFVLVDAPPPSLISALSMFVVGYLWLRAFYLNFGIAMITTIVSGFIISFGSLLLYEWFDLPDGGGSIMVLSMLYFYTIILVSEYNRIFETYI